VQKKSKGKKCLFRQVYAGHGFEQCLSVNNQVQNQNIVEVESRVKRYSEKHANIYSLVEFACCRDTKYKLDFSQEEEKEETKTVEQKKLINFTFLFGCRPRTGDEIGTKYAEEIISLFRRADHRDDDFVYIPKVFSKVINSDANFETTTHNCAQKLCT
jgi:hypothetical protein